MSERPRAPYCVVPIQVGRFSWHEALAILSSLAYSEMTNNWVWRGGVTDYDATLHAEKALWAELDAAYPELVKRYSDFRPATMKRDDDGVG